MQRRSYGLAMALAAACVLLAWPAQRQQATAQEGAANQVQVNVSGVTNTYANFVRVTGTPEELIMDFGLNPKLGQATEGPIDINQRVVMNYYSAKRMMGALQLAIERHEAAFGPIETDIRQRIRDGVQ